MKARVTRGSVQAVLTASRSRKITLFGELPPDQRASYFSRTTVSVVQHTNNTIGSDLDPDIDPSGQRMVFSSTRHNTSPDLYLKSIQGVAVTQLTGDPASDVQPAFSPDGSSVAFASNRSGNWDIWIISVNGGQPIQVTDTPADELHPSWSDDGNRLVFCSLQAEGGQWELWTSDATSGGTLRFIGYGLFPEWSPSGETILYQRARERGSRDFSVWTLTLIDGEPRYPTEVASHPRYALILPTWNSDGTRIAFTSITNNIQVEEPVGGSVNATPATTPPITSADIWVMATDGRNKVRLTDGFTRNLAPVFGEDGRIYFVSDRSGSENIWSLAASSPAITASLPRDNGISRVQASARPTTSQRGDVTTTTVWHGP